MIRIGLTVLALIWASDATAQSWTVTMQVSGAVEGELDMSGTRNTIWSDGQGNYLSAEAFGVGVGTSETTCATAQSLEIDYFFGNETSLGGHLLFTLERAGSGYDVIDPTIFVDTLNNNQDVTETYAAFSGVGMSVDRVACGDDGTLSIAVTYKGRLLSNIGEGPQQVLVSGTADSEFILKDMSEY